MDQKTVRKERKATDLTQKELSALRAITKLSDKEIKLWHTEFLNKYPTGKLDRNAFIDTYKQLYPDDKSTAASQSFDMVDKNHDGTIDFNEFLFFFAVSGISGSLDERLDLIFDLWDVSDDGLIDQNELAHLISAMYDRGGIKDRQGEKNPTKRAKVIITKLDISGDRKLSREEFIKGCKSDEVIASLLAPNH